MKSIAQMSLGEFAICASNEALLRVCDEASP